MLNGKLNALNLEYKLNIECIVEHIRQNYI